MKQINRVISPKSQLAPIHAYGLNQCSENWTGFQELNSTNVMNEEVLNKSPSILSILVKILDHRKDAKVLFNKWAEFLYMIKLAYLMLVYNAIDVLFIL